ncbi:MAG: aromatic aminobenezylarsenical efflux permease ArsG family transporter [Planctomycetota bacterium]|nr:aromatic aminobenezylarsenical efflux permease ArsG family transporter [Planctomycetota bacterium]
MIFLGIISALWLGILTSLSPCPLATNIAAISFIGKRVGSGRYVLLSGLAYTLGRMATYLGVGVVVVLGVLSIPGVSAFLQTYMNKILGPVLILAGMFLLGLIRLRPAGVLAGRKVQEKAERGGLLAAGLLGIVFALSFCPVSAALFFGGLVPLALKHQSGVLFPLFYGVGTALPVIVFAVLLATGARFVGAAFNGLTQVEKWSRRITGATFIVVGIYYSLAYIFDLL